LESARITGGTPIAQGPAKVGLAEQSVADALGIPIDQNFSAKVVVNASEKGAASGVASLGSDARVPAAQLPTATWVNLYTSADVGIASGVETAVMWDVEAADPDNLHNLVNKQLVTIAVAGVYFVGAAVQFAPNATGQRLLDVCFGAMLGRDSRETAGGGLVTGLVAFGVVYLWPGNTIFVNVYQNSGGGLNLLGGGTSRLYVVKLS
jgi:hypothetical protein